MAIPRFKPGVIWSDKDWANLPIKGSDLAAGLCAAGYTVLGITNKKPELQEKLNSTELQLLVESILRGEASSIPSPIGSDADESETVQKPSKKKGKR